LYRFIPKRKNCIDAAHRAATLVFDQSGCELAQQVDQQTIKAKNTKGELGNEYNFLQRLRLHE